MHIGSELTKLFNLTDKLAQQRDDQYISSELFVLAAMDDKSPLKGVMLQQAGAVRGAIEKSIDDLRGGQQVNDPNAEDTRQALDKYTIDLTERAEQGKLDPIIGRDDDDSAHHPDPAAPHQEQPRVDRRTRRRQDRDP